MHINRYVFPSVKLSTLKLSTLKLSNTLLSSFSLYICLGYTWNWKRESKLPIWIHKIDLYTSAAWSYKESKQERRLSSFNLSSRDLLDWLQMVRETQPESVINSFEFPWDWTIFYLWLILPNSGNDILSFGFQCVNSRRDIVTKS